MSYQFIKRQLQQVLKKYPDDKTLEYVGDYMDHLEFARDYPSLFSQLWLDRSQTPMYYGIQCGRGWWPLIRSMCDELKDISPDLHFIQIKEKFGKLRVYTNMHEDEVFKIVSKYEDMSVSVCETCGEPGELKDVNGWWTTTCEGCVKDEQDS